MKHVVLKGIDVTFRCCKWYKTIKNEMILEGVEVLASIMNRVYMASIYKHYYKKKAFLFACMYTKLNKMEKLILGQVQKGRPVH